MSAAIVSTSLAADRVAPPPDDPAERQSAFARFAARSNDLRLRIVFSRDADGTMSSPELDALIEAARGSTDPLVLQLLLDRCRDRQAANCDAGDLARRWSIVDAQNVIAWVELAAVLEAAGDRDGSDEAWARAGRASTFREATTTIARHLRASMRSDDRPRSRYFDATYALGVASAVPQRWIIDTKNGCKQDERRATCAHIADTIFRDAESISDLAFARALTSQARQPEWIYRSRRQTEEALEWGRTRALGDGDLDVVATLSDARLEAHARKLDRLIERGDIVVARDELHARRISEAEASKRYAVDMAALMNRLHPN